MTYSFEWQGLQFLMADRQEPQKRNPSMLVRATGLPCLELGAQSCYRLALELVIMLGGHIEREKLSRVDMCTDVPGQAINPFVDAYHERRYVTRAKSHGIKCSNGITITFGEAPLSLRVYDKMAELRKKRDGHKHSLMAYHRWSGIEPDHAIRVEFQIGREALKARGVDTVNDYFERRSDLARYLCHDWFRMTCTVPDRTHTTRAPTLSLWKRISDGFLGWTGQPSGLMLDPLPREAADVDALIRGAAGTILTAGVIQDCSFQNEEDLMRYAMTKLRREFSEMGWRERMRRKKIAFADQE